MASTTLKPVWFAIGNPLRADDGVAHRVAELLGLADRIRAVHQLTPELAAELEDATEAVFLDADAIATQVTVEPLLPEASVAFPDTHHMAPATVVALARRLYGFHGQAWLCRIPARDFSLREGLSPQGEMHSQIASHILKQKGEQLHAPIVSTFVCDLHGLARGHL